MSYINYYRYGGISGLLSYETATHTFLFRYKWCALLKVDYEYWLKCYCKTYQKLF